MKRIALSFLLILLFISTHTLAKDSASKESFEEKILLLEQKIRAQEAQIQNILNEQRRNHEHHIKDIDEFKKSSEALFNSQIISKWHEAKANTIVGIILYILASGGVIWLTLDTLFKNHLRRKHKKLVEKYSKEAAENHLALIACLSGVSLHQWWLYYENNPQQNDKEFQLTISSIAELTVNAVRRIPKNHPNYKFASQFITNTLYYLADTKDKKDIAARKPLVKRVIKDVEKEYHQVPQGLRDIRWAEDMECVCFANYVYKLKTKSHIKKQLSEILGILKSNPARVKEIKDTYTKISI